MYSVNRDATLPRFATCFILATVILILSEPINAQSRSNHGIKFEQINDMLPSPNNFRSMDGTPGPDY